MKERKDLSETKKTLFVFGNGMLPFLKPGSQVQIRSIPVNGFRLGDLLAYQSEGHLRIRRVVRVQQQDGEIRLLTKGDNRFSSDGTVNADAIEGKVHQNFSPSFYERFLSRLLVYISYYPSAISIRIIAWLPKGKRLAGKYAGVLQPLLVYNRCSKAWKAVSRVPAVLRSEVRLRNYKVTDADEVASLWDRCFPNAPMDMAHFVKKICGSPWFSAEGCFLAVKRSEIVGFILASERRYRCGERPFSRAGFIECVCVDLKERRQGIGSSLVKNALRFLRKKDCRTFKTGYFPIPVDGEGLVKRAVVSDFFGNLGFEITNFDKEFRVYPERWDLSIAGRWIERLRKRGVEVRLAATSDKLSLQNAMRGWKRRWHYPDDVNIDETDMRTYIISVKNDRILGYCRAIPQNQASSYDEYDWIWDASIDKQRGSVGFLYVDPEYRSLGLGAALAAAAFNSLFERNCKEIWGSVRFSLPGLIERYRRWGLEEVGAVVMMSKKLDEFMSNDWEV